MKPEVMQVIDDARQLLIQPESWIGCFALSQDANGKDVWDVPDLEKADRLSLMGALDLAAHRRKYPKSVSDAVVSFLYPLCWQHITTPYPFPHELIEDLAEGGNFMYEEFGYFNDQDGRTHAEVMEVLNTALAHGYAKTIPSLPTANDAVKRSFTELSAENKVSCQRQLSELIGDESQEFGKALVDHFPPEDGMPDFGDVQDFMCNWDDRYHDDEIVERALNIMQLIYHDEKD